MIGLVDGNNFFVSCERVFNRRLVGRPVAVLSNNDGCCVSRSNEFKARGIPMAVFLDALAEVTRGRVNHDPHLGFVVAERGSVELRSLLQLDKVVAAAEGKEVYR